MTPTIPSIAMTQELRSLAERCNHPEFRTDQFGAEKVLAGGYSAYYAAAWVHALAVGIDCERASKTPKIQAAAIAAFRSIMPQIVILAAEREPRLRYLLPRVSSLMSGKDFHSLLSRP